MAQTAYSGIGKYEVYNERMAAAMMDKLFFVDKVPADVWSGWLARLGLEQPFPPATFVQAPKTKKRAVLAEALNISRDVIYQRWLRLKQKLQKQLKVVSSGPSDLNELNPEPKSSPGSAQEKRGSDPVHSA